MQCSAKRNNLINGFFNKNLTPGRMAEFPRGRLRKRVTRLTFFTPIKRVLKVVCLSVGATCNNIHVLEKNFSCFKLQFVLPQQTWDDYVDDDDEDNNNQISTNISITIPCAMKSPTDILISEKTLLQVKWIKWTCCCCIGINEECRLNWVLQAVYIILRTLFGINSIRQEMETWFGTVEEETNYTW